MLQSFQSTKLYDGFSTVFRQWKATDTHCKYLHGYALSVRVTFSGDLDQRNWVYDFGGFKRAKTKINGKTPKEYLDWLLDHTTIIAEDDPELDTFMELHERGIIQLRILPDTGAERLAEHLYGLIHKFVQTETNDRVGVVRLEVLENRKNSASFGVSHG